MLSKPGKKQLQAAIWLTQQAFWPELKGLIEQERALLFERLTDAQNPVLLHQYQGRAQALKDFLTFLARAKETLERVERSAGGSSGETFNRPG